uniref:Uncharacterized protein n=2 Tax=Noccaea caerulescens TaxID=107243 RepID=A0A1J3DVD9_NOCCA
MRISELQNPNTTLLESLLDYFICLPHTGQRNSLHTRANSPKRPFFHAIGDAIAYIFLVKILSLLDVYKSVRQEMFTLGKSSCYHVAKKWARGTPLKVVLKSLTSLVRSVFSDFLTYYPLTKTGRTAITRKKVGESPSAFHKSSQSRIQPFSRGAIPCVL